MSKINDNQILEEIRKQYEALLEEDKIEAAKKQIRDIRLSALRAAIDGFEAILKPLPDEAIKTKVEEALKGNFERDKFAYPYDKTWEDRIKAYLKYMNVPVKITDIIQAFREYEPNYSETKLKGAVNNTVQTMFKRGRLKIYTPPKREKGFYYGNPLWFENDVLKNEHLPNLNRKFEW